MSVTNKVYIGTIGFEFIVDCNSTITGATALTLEVKKPNGVTDSWTATEYDTTHLTYTSVSGDLDQSGTYQFQAKATIGSWEGYGDTFDLTIYNLWE